MVTKPGYLLATNYRMAFFPASSFGPQEPITEQTLLNHLTARFATSFNCFPLGFARMVKAQEVLPFEAADDRKSFFDSSVSNTLLRIVLVDGRILVWEILHTHLPRNKHTAESVVRLLDRSQTKPFAFSFKVAGTCVFPPQTHLFFSKKAQHALFVRWLVGV